MRAEGAVWQYFRRSQATPRPAFGILSGLPAGDGAVAIPAGQHFAVPIPAPLLPAAGRTYTVVMKIRVPGDEGWRSLLNMPASNDSDAMVYLHRTTRNIYLKQFDKSSGAGVAATNGNVPADRWSTLAFAFGEDATDVYLDGTAVLHGTGALAGSYADCAASGGYILVGADDSGDDGLFYLSDFRIYEGVVAIAGFLPGSGTAADPYLISSAEDWSVFAANVRNGIGSAACYRLAADIGSVAVSAGGAGAPFSGVFDGGGHTLTVALSGTDPYVAPFYAISGATISNLVVAGTVGGGMHCSGLVGLVAGGTNTIENCRIAAAISTSRSHFGGIVGHGYVADTTLRGCVFSGSLSGGTYVATFNAWSDDGATTRVVDCLDASASAQPIGRGADAALVTNAYYAASKSFANAERLWSAGNRGKRAYAVTEGEGVSIDFGAPVATYGTSGIAVYATGIVYQDVFYAGSGETVSLSPAFTGTPPAGKKHDGFAASAGELAKSGDAWVLTMPAGDVAISATFADATAYEIWAAENGITGAWDETDALGVHNVFRYAFDDTNAVPDPAFLSISFDSDGRPVVLTPPLNPTAGDFFEFELLAAEVLDESAFTDGTNLVFHSTFDTDISGWAKHMETGGGCTLYGADGKLALKVSCVGSENYSVQVFHDGVPLYRNGRYRLKYDISSTMDRYVEAMIQGAGGTYQAYTWRGLDITPEPQTVDYEFTMDQDTDTMSKLVFNCGLQEKDPDLPGHTIYIDNVSLELLNPEGFGQACVSWPLSPTGTNVIAGDIPPVRFFRLRAKEK